MKCINCSHAYFEYRSNAEESFFVFLEKRGRNLVICIALIIILKTPFSLTFLEKVYLSHFNNINTNYETFTKLDLMKMGKMRHWLSLQSILIVRNIEKQ